jgi:8-oxo-dGTP diphosphatase
MIYLRQTFQVNPDQFERCTHFFHEYTLPIHMGHGARLVGRYTTRSHEEVTTIWEFNSYDHYQSLKEKMEKSELFGKSEKRREQLGSLYKEVREEFIEATGDYHFPKQIVSVSAYITNGDGEVLLVKNEHRSDTFEMPGGRMEMEEAVRREVLEETGVNAVITGVTGVYQNVTSGIVCVVFKGEYTSGELRTQPGETKAVTFQDLDKINLDEFVTKEHFKIRITDARSDDGVALESYYVRPYEVVHRMES